jgi:cobalamin biosynthesis Mg chelatase CobN
MKRMTTLILALLAVLAVAPAAQANEFKDIFGAYRKSGAVDGCKYTAKQLADAKRQVPNDIEQYAPDFPNALDDAIQKRAAGGCAKTAAAAAGAPAAGTTTPAAPGTPATGAAATTPGATSPPAQGQAPQPTPSPGAATATGDKAILAASKQRSSDAGVPAPLVALAVIGGLMLLAALAYWLARWWAWEPRWLVRGRHAGAEAGWRASISWAEFMDWVRLGR